VQWGQPTEEKTGRATAAEQVEETAGGRATKKGLRKVRQTEKELGAGPGPGKGAGLAGARAGPRKRWGVESPKR